MLDYNNDIIIKKYSSKYIYSNMYIVSFQGHSIIIDPCISKEALIDIKDNLLSIDYIILTHEHYDHISGVNWLKGLFKCKVICNSECAKAIPYPNLNLSKYFDVLIEVLPEDKKPIKSLTVKPYSCFADIIFQNQKSVEWKGYKLDLISTPGHSKGSICILLDDKYLFSGDSLLRDYPTVTRLKGGNSKTYKDKTLKFLKSLSSEIAVFPGHYEPFVLKDGINNSNI